MMVLLLAVLMKLWLVFYSCVLASNQCSVSVEWLCLRMNNSQPECFDSLEEAISSAEQEAKKCQEQLKVNFTINSVSLNLSSNVTFNSAQFSQVVFTAPRGTFIQCKFGTASLKFIGNINASVPPMEICIENITFSSCGPGNEIVHSALFFSHNCQIQIIAVHVEGSNGSGLAFVNVSGNVNVTRSTFTKNIFNNGLGAGVYISLTSISTETNYTFSHSIFTKNCAKSISSARYEVESSSTKGGGLFIQYGNNTRNVHLLISKCIFSYNKAHWGAGLLGSFEGNSLNNSLCIISATFKNNQGSNTNMTSGQYVAGAGSMIAVSGNSTNNAVDIVKCNFTNNTAEWGGGLEIYSSHHNSPDKTESNYNDLNVRHCHFENNTAYSGAAINIFCSSPVTRPQICNANPLVSDSIFISNGNQSLISLHHQMTVSVVSISHFPTTLKGNLTFSHNFGSPLHIHETSVTLGENAILHFNNNAARNGGAISIFGSWIAVLNNCTLVFSNNRAIERGGAIYSFMTEEAYLPYSHRCFIRYSNGEQQQEHWNASFTFTSNTASGMVEHIYATSLLPCVLWSSNFSLDHNIKQTFCSWNKWYFIGGTCPSEVHTSARNFSSTTTEMSVFPGIPSSDHISAVDDFGNQVSNFTINPIVLHNQNVTSQVVNRSLIVCGKENTNVTVLLELEGERSIFLTVSAILNSCPPGFWFEDSSLSCICNLSRHIHCEYKAGSRWVAYLVIGYCMSYSQVNYEGNRKWHVVYGRCPFTSGLHSQSFQDTYIPFLPLPLQKGELDSKFCGKLNRRGILCGSCIKDYSINVFSDVFHCHNCSGSMNEWIKFVTIEGLLPLLFFVIVLLLHISVTSGPVNGFIFFSQILTISLEVIIIKSAWSTSSIKHHKVFSQGIVSIYSVWSLDFFRLINLVDDDYEMCLGPKIKVMHVLGLRYLSAVYPLCFLLIAFIVIELHARNCCLFVWLWKPLCYLCARFRQAWKAQTSIVDAFAAFILLSYVKLVRISLLLVTYSLVYINNSPSVKLKVVNYDPTVPFLSSEHAPFAAVGALFLLTFGLMPPLLLTFYQFQFCQKCLNRFKLNRNELRIFMDAYQGCYKDAKNGGPDRRYFAGLYFIFRLIIYGIFDMTTTLSFTYILLLVAFIIFSIITALLQPYKKPLYTFIDTFFFSLLAVIMALHAYSLFLISSETHAFSHVLTFTSVLIMIPQLYFILFVLYWLCQRIPKCVRTRVLHAISCRCFNCLAKFFPPECPQNDVVSVTYAEDEVDDIPDRLVHSFRYRSLNVQTIVPFDDK